MPAALYLGRARHQEWHADRILFKDVRGQRIEFGAKFCKSGRIALQRSDQLRQWADGFFLRCAEVRKAECLSS